MESKENDKEAQRKWKQSLFDLQLQEQAAIFNIKIMKKLKSLYQKISENNNENNFNIFQIPFVNLMSSLDNKNIGINNINMSHSSFGFSFNSWWITINNQTIKKQI